MYTIDSPEKSEYPDMLKVWESSVRATHHFLNNDHIEDIKKIIREKEIFDHMNLTCARDSSRNILGIMGTSEENLDMLFIDARFIGRGIGKLLLFHAMNDLKITKVDVNEQNEQALQFYQNFGFHIVSRSACDDNGLPFPILHLQLARTLWHDGNEN
jgi:putative acetyltransferase